MKFQFFCFEIGSLISVFLLQPNVVGFLKRLSKFIKLLGIGGFKVMFA